VYAVLHTFKKHAERLLCVVNYFSAPYKNTRPLMAYHYHIYIPTYRKEKRGRLGLVALHFRDHLVAAHTSVVLISISPRLVTGPHLLRAKGRER
jgi:hypothetical protein